MNGIVAVKKEVLPAHAWQKLSGKGSGPSSAAGEGGRVVKLGSLPDWRQREIVAERIVDAASRTKAAPLSRKEIDAWTARLLDANAALNNHSC